MIIGSISENIKVEKRVALTPEILKKYKTLGLKHFGFTDSDETDSC